MYKLIKHLNRTAEIAVLFGNHLNLSENEIRSLYLAGKYHDIGKILIPKNLLYKEGKLTKDEFEIIKNHPNYSYKLLEDTRGVFSKDVLRAIKEHHERIDGKGYPLGISGNKIFYLSKILSLCDSYDAMISNRCYQEKKSKKEAIIEIERGLGTQFDKELGLSFINFIKLS